MMLWALSTRSGARLARPRSCAARARGRAGDAGPARVPSQLAEGSGSPVDAPLSPVERRSPGAVAEEMRKSYALVERVGRGVVWLGSSRARPRANGTDEGHYERAQELARRVHGLLGTPAWSGAGPGLMQAASEGALAAGQPAAGLKILWGEAQQAAGAEAFEHPYLPRARYEVVEFFSARKHGLVDAGVRARVSDRTAYICLPGGLGTLDEFFEVVCLSQLQRLQKGSAHPTPPALLVNYNGCYDGVAQLVADAQRFGYVAEGECEPHFTMCTSNDDVIAALEAFYGVREAPPA